MFTSMQNYQILFNYLLTVMKLCHIKCDKKFYTTRKRQNFDISATAGL